MNLHSAAHYLKSGYQLRRPDWESGEYVYTDDEVLCVRRHEHHSHSVGYWVLELDDLLADDWEIFKPNPWEAQ